MAVPEVSFCFTIPLDQLQGNLGAINFLDVDVVQRRLESRCRALM